MTTDKIIAKIRAQERQIRAEGVEHLSIFGSRTRGDEHDASDLDVLIEVAPGGRFSLLNLSGVGLLIEDATGLPTQVVLSRSVPKDFKDRISGDLTRVF